jgi:hypothetical protein
MPDSPQQISLINSPNEVPINDSRLGAGAHGGPGAADLPSHRRTGHAAPATRFHAGTASHSNSTVPIQVYKNKHSQ